MRPLHIAHRKRRHHDVTDRCASSDYGDQSYAAHVVYSARISEHTHSCNQKFISEVGGGFSRVPFLLVLSPSVFPPSFPRPRSGPSNRAERLVRAPLADGCVTGKEVNKTKQNYALLTPLQALFDCFSGFSAHRLFFSFILSIFLLRHHVEKRADYLLGFDCTLNTGISYRTINDNTNGNKTVLQAFLANSLRPLRHDPPKVVL